MYPLLINKEQATKEHGHSETPHRQFSLCESSDQEDSDKLS